MTIFPSALGGVNYSPASYDPATNYVFNAAAETAAVLIQDKLTPTQKRRKLIQGDVFLGLQNGNFGGPLASWRDHGSISAINVATGRRVWKFQTPEPERGGVTTTASGLGFAGGGDGVLRAFDLKTGKVLWRFQTGAPIAAGPTLYLNGGKEYLAITVGGTPTSSNGGTLAELQVFAIGGSQQQSPPPLCDHTRGVRSRSCTARPLDALGPAGCARSGRGSEGRRPHRDRRPDSRARLASVGQQHRERRRPAARRRQAGLRRPDLGRPLRAAAGDRRRWALHRLDRRHRRAPSPRQGRRPLAGPRRRPPADGRRTGVGPRRYRRLHRRLPDRRPESERGQSGNVVVTGRIATRGGFAPAGVSLFTYRLSGRITGADGKPVAGATVVTRTIDRDFWTFSEPSDADGNYTSFFAASDKSQEDPVQFSVQVALGPVSYSSGLIPTVKFKRLRSARMDVQLPARVGGVLPLPTSSSYEGAVYQGLLVGASVGGRVVKPLAAQWPDAKGRFRLVLPASARGKTVSALAEQFPGVRNLPGEAGRRRRPPHLARRPVAARLDRDGERAAAGLARR